MFVQFTDETESTIGSYFAANQDPKIWPGIVEIDDDDPRLIALLNPPLADENGTLEKLKKFISENPDVAELLK